MKVSSIALFASLIVSADAIGFRDLVEKVSNRHTESAAAETATDIEGAGQENRELQGGCWNNKNTAAAWHPTYSAGWRNGYCQFNIDCKSPSYSSQLTCCKSAYAGQFGGYCLSTLPSPPTMSPTVSGGLNVYYPDYGTSWSNAFCINTRPLPSGRPTYSTMLACCKGAYGGQMSGKCLSELPSPPTGSPTNSAMEADFWYPHYDTVWSEAGCSNKLPLPFNNPNDRPQYSSQLSCCKAAYAGQTSGKCLSQLPSPPTMTPTGSGGAGFYYADYDTPWSDATCLNTRPLPFGPGGRPTYGSMIACCKGAYAGQTSGACMAALLSPPTPKNSCSNGDRKFKGSKGFHVQSIVAFGDSLTDTGNADQFSPCTQVSVYCGDRQSNGPVVLEYLNDAFDLPPVTPGLTTDNSDPIGPTPSGGNNYAVSSATGGNSGDDNNFVMQMSAYLGFLAFSQGVTVPTIDADVLHFIWFGANDVRHALELFFTSPEPALALGYIDDAIDDMKDEIQNLIALGACSFLVLGTVDVAIAPLIAGGPAAGQARVLSIMFNTKLEAMLGDLTLTNMDDSCLGIKYIDMIPLVDDILEDECLTEAFPVPDFTAACNDRFSDGLPVLLEEDIDLDCEGVLFYDELHPTTLVSEIMAFAILEYLYMEIMRE